MSLCVIERHVTKSLTISLQFIINEFVLKIEKRLAMKKLNDNKKSFKYLY